MQEKVLLLTADNISTDDRRAERLLQFFGVPYQRQRLSDFAGVKETSAAEKYRLICAAPAFTRVIPYLRNGSHDSNEFARRIHSVFLYSSGDSSALANVVHQLCGGGISSCTGLGTDTEWRVADDISGICGAMRGLCVHPAPTVLGSGNLLHVDAANATALIAAARKAAFLKVIYKGVPVFVSSERLIDIDAELTTGNFDVRDHLFSALPVVSYIRWACAHSAWNAPEANACLVIDDPLLRPRYGFIRFADLLALMKQFRFSTSVAFIPWNWRRSNPKVVELFRNNPELYSICIHGCDHTSAEFSTSARERLGAIVSEALRRMSLHQERTGLAHDRIMVFPQGMFSEEAILELKCAGFDAAVNTEVHSNPSEAHKVKIADVWDTAVMSYGDFPIYTRRYPTQGIENFAFDLLLGKPCLVVIHHDFCSDGYERLLGFIEQLNTLRVPIVWRCLGDVVSRSYRQKQASANSVQIELYGNKTLIENFSSQSKRYFIGRREHAAQSIESISAGPHRLSWDSAEDRIQLELELSAGESAFLAVQFKSGEDVGPQRQNVAYNAKTMLRRYLSEARDNYVVPAKARMLALSHS